MESDTGMFWDFMVSDAGGDCLVILMENQNRSQIYLK